MAARRKEQKRIEQDMEYRNFKDITDNCAGREKKMRMAVAGAADLPVLQAAFQASCEGIAEPVLIGDPDGIRELMRREGIGEDLFRIVRADTPAECGIRAVELVRDGGADFIMKGMVQTRDVMKPLVDKSNGLNTGRTMCVLAYNEVPAFGKMLAISDGGMIPYPTLEQKRDIIINCVEALQKIGIGRPSVAVLAAAEKVDPKIPETVDAAELVRMNREGVISGCDVVGPVSLDIAMDRGIAEHKGFDDPHCGSFDMVLVPNMAAGNLLTKAMILTGGAKMAGVIVGAKVPVVLSSRGASEEEKFASVALAAMLA